jgi:hypothetical protein
MTSNEFVNVPVPPNRVQEVYNLLARSRTTSEATTATSQNPSAGAKSEPPWDAENVRRFYKESSPNMQAFLRVLADKAPSTVTTTEAGKDLPKGAQSVAGMLGAAGRRSSGRHGRGLPWRKWYQPTDNQGSETVFEMSEEVAAAIKTVL